MARSGSRWILVLVAGAVVAWLGCRPATPPEEQPGKPAQPAEAAPGEPAPGETAAGTEEKPVFPEPKPEPPPPPKIPEVHLPEHLVQASVVQVGDAMPEGELTTPEGQPQPIQPLLDQKPAVVFFWKGDDLYAQMAAVDAMQFLEAEVAQPYGQDAVRVVAVNVGNTAEQVKERIAEASPSFPVLLDPKGEYFAKVASERVPRIYLLDAEGKILWFDTEYSRTTRSGLSQSLQVILGKPPAKP